MTCDMCTDFSTEKKYANYMCYCYIQSKFQGSIYILLTIRKLGYFLKQYCYSLSKIQQNHNVLYSIKLRILIIENVQNKS